MNDTEIPGTPVYLCVEMNSDKATEIPPTMRWAEITEIFGVGRQTVRRWIRHGRFPKPLKAPGRYSIWNRAEINRFLEEASKHDG